MPHLSINSEDLKIAQPNQYAKSGEGFWEIKARQIQVFHWFYKIIADNFENMYNKLTNFLVLVQYTYQDIAITIIRYLPENLAKIDESLNL